MKSLFYLIVCFSLLQTASATRIYVDTDATAGGDGTSWATAHKYLQDALDQTVADRSDEVWIAAGTYYPDDGANVTEGDRTMTFTLKEGVTIYGGFNGTESSESQRDLELNESILSGEIFADQLYWSLHVVTLAGSASLDGITITKGNANGDEAPFNQGGGLLAGSYNIEISNCTFSNNTADKGGAMYAASTTTVSNCTFSNNTADSGGAISASGSTTTVTNCTFSSNTASINGGAISASTTITVNNCTFSSNTATYNGGAIYARSTTTVNNCTFSNNTADQGGVIYIRGSSTTTTAAVSNCTFSNNTASSGGAIYIYVGITTVSNCTFSNNTATFGGAILIYGGSVTTAAVTNCTFSSNTASSGGAILTQSVTTVTNCTFWHNSSVNPSGGFAIYSSKILKLLNNIIADDYTSEGTQRIHLTSSASLRNEDSAFPSPSDQSKNFIRGGLASITVEEGAIVSLGDTSALILTGDPGFEDTTNPIGEDGIWGTNDDGLRLSEGSQAIDQGLTRYIPQDTGDVDQDGDTNEIIPVDLAGNLRLQGTTVDLGAYEYGNSTELLYTLTVESANGGSVTPSGSQNYTNGANQTLTASSSPGYIFDQWTGDASGNTNPLSFTVDQNLSITATFTPDLADPDEDGLTNYQELVTYGTNPQVSDSSGDGLKDGDVASAGFDPNTDHRSLMTLMGSKMEDARTGSTMISVTNSTALLRLQIERSTDLTSWSEDPEDIIEVEIPLSGEKNFFRFAIPQE